MGKVRFTIKDYRKEDYPGLTLLWEETGLGNPERGDNAETIENCLAIGGKLLVMFSSDEPLPIGSSWMTFDGRRFHLHHFCVKPAWQNAGLGKKLAIETIRFIREKGFQVKLEVHKENHIAKKLYEDLGFFTFNDYEIYMLRDTKSSTIPGDIKTES